MAKRKPLPKNWRKNLELVLGSEYRSFGQWNQYDFRLVFKEGKTPKGYPREIGSLTIEAGHKDDRKFYVDVSYINERFQNKGLGTLLYTSAIQELGQLTTYYHSASWKAQKLWDRLRRMTGITTMGCRFRSETNFFDQTLTLYRKRAK
jgi:hypothetical protein